MTEGIGEAPPELDGRVASTIGAGYLFTKGRGVKVGGLVYRDAAVNDDLSLSFHVGITYDLLSGLVSAEK